MKLKLAIIGFSLLTFLSIGSAKATTFTCSLAGTTINCNFPSTIETAINKIANSTNLKMITSGTEYLPNDNGTVFVRILDGNSNPINLASCNTTIYFPNKTSKFINNQPLTFLEKGNYYRDFTLGNEIGNYITNFDCIFPTETFSQNQTILQSLSAGSPSFSDVFPFDNSNNLTINSAWLSIHITVTVGSSDVFFAGNKVFSGIGNGLFNTTLTASNFSLTENQQYTLERLTGNPTFDWLMLYVNFTANNPQQIIRGHNEVHVRSDASRSLNVNLTQLNDTINTFTNENRVLVEGTEYISNETGILTAQFTRVTGGTPVPVNNGNCLLNVTFPNTTTKLFTNENMTYLTSSNGIYFKNFTVPMEQGIYIADVRCTLVSPSTTAFSHNTFHVSNLIVTKVDVLPFNIWNFANRTITTVENVLNVTNVQTVFNVTALSENVLDEIAFRVLQLLLGVRALRINGV